ncbi:Co2+/Mg2+ efflux protein ApaG [Alphaproteobacteria bacterium]|nr:Co2+/Mg2+ efflux protein ApaG [Alphaproteobacteria bacterium]
MSLKPYIKDNIEYYYTEVTKNIRVSVKTNFLSDQSDTENNLWVWSYHILIENNGNDKVQLIDRYWKITDATGIIKEVKGSGVIGEQPTIKPGEFFEYTSGTPLNKSSGFMSGNYRMINENNESFFIDVPVFSLDIPSVQKILN